MPLVFASLPVENPLDGFSTGLVYSYIAFNRTREVQALDEVVFGVLEFYMGKSASHRLRDLPGSTRLTRDVGCGLQTIEDTLCMLEMLFGVEFSAAEIAQVHTLEDLRQLVAGRVATAS